MYVCTCVCVWLCVVNTQALHKNYPDVCKFYLPDITRELNLDIFIAFFVIYLDYATSICLDPTSYAHDRQVMCVSGVCVCVCEAVCVLGHMHI